MWETRRQRQQMEKRQNLIAFWLLGVINNSVYVIMLAGAKGGWIEWVGMGWIVFRMN